MKINDLLEARRNKDHPSQQVDRIPGKGQKHFNDLISQYLNEDGIYLSFTELPKLGINPSPQATSTPNGIYGYPIEYLRDDIKNHGLAAFPLGAKRPWVNVFKCNKPLLNVNNYTIEDFNNDITKLKSIFDEGKMLNAIAIANSQRHPYKMLSEVLKFLARNEGLRNHVKLTTWSSLFIKLGYYGLIDDGEGLIHLAEPSQVVVFRLSDIQLLERINLKTGARSYRIYDEKQKQTPREFINLIKTLQTTNTPRSAKIIDMIIDKLDKFSSFAKYIQQDTLYELAVYFLKNTPKFRLGLIPYMEPETLLKVLTEMDRGIDWKNVKNLSDLSDSIDIEIYDQALQINKFLY